MKEKNFEEMFKPTGKGNFVFICGDDFYISYNPCPCPVPIGPLSDETAIYNFRERKFYILNGDFREEYLKLSTSGWEKCYKFFKEREVFFGSTWTMGE